MFKVDVDKGLREQSLNPGALVVNDKRFQQGEAVPPLNRPGEFHDPLLSRQSETSNVSCYASLGGFMLCCFLMGLLSLSWAALYRNPDCDKRIGQVNINHCKDENDLFNLIQSIVAIAGGGLTLVPVVWLVGLKCCCYSFNKPESYTLLEGTYPVVLDRK